MSFIASSVASSVIGGLAAGAAGYGLTQLMGGGSGSVPSGPYGGGSWTPPNMNSAANLAYGNIANLNVSPYALPMAQQTYNQMGQTMGAGNQLYQTALDPQQQLYNRMYALNQNQAAANQAARGLAMSPVGAQMSNQAGQNFNMDWQNQLLGRQALGLQGMTAANTSAGNLGNLALNYSNQPNIVTQQQINDWMGYTGQGMQGAGTGVNAFNATAPYQQAAIGAITQPLGQWAGQAYSGYSPYGSYGDTAAQNASYMGDPSSTAVNFPT